MAATLLDGKALAKKIQAELAEQVAVFTEQTQKVPTLATVLVGEDPASQVYIRNKIRSCERVGMESRHIPLPADVSQEALMEEVQQLNRDDTVHGILVQLPLPDELDAQPILDAILPAKDVDAFHPENVGLLSQGRPRYLPCTPHGVIQLLHRAGIETAGKHCVIVGRSDIVGKPLGLMLVQRQSGCGPTAANATVTICHSRTQNLRDITKQADVLIAAIGQAEFITAEMVKPGSVVVDVGINRGENGLVGDVAFEEVSEVAAAITPVPGGVGPLTVTMLLENTLRAAQHQAATETESA
ncbi:MAG: bifunctional methylenetetrahydrofolate dehydrogenase/methenyltetrahydrofolate cyclohydrolase FolD [Planctomycetota bacterium]|nr:bifunctional methylenetetrahydrofolate dehydrogenase/methenyltetrahydrofolate cyclohydrolase FolD [Planctomycetota bacterium]